MKKFITFFVVFIFITSPVLAKADKTGEDYLKNSKHPFSMNFIGESIVKSGIKHALKKEAPGKYKVKFKGYTLSSIKKGIFKYLEITGEDVTVNNIEIPYFNLKTITDYNWVDYNQEPIAIKTDMELDSVIHLSDKSVNDALASEEYNKILRHINKKAYPIFTINGTKVKIKDNKFYIVIIYNFPLAPKAKDRTFVVSSKLKVSNNEIQPYDAAFNSVYGNLPLQKVTNLINMLNPLNFTVKLIDDKNCDAKIEQIEIIDDIIKINGKIYVKGEK